MKSIPVIEIELNQLLHEAQEVKRTTKLIGRINNLKQLIAYLETEPTEDFVKAQLDKLEAQIKELNNRCPHKDLTDKRRKEWLKKEGIQHLRKQIRNCNYLLS